MGSQLKEKGLEKTGRYLKSKKEDNTVYSK